MRERYTYEIATRSQNGSWRIALIHDDTFSRDPESIARSLLEQWIIDHQGKLPGGRVFIYRGQHQLSDRITPTVRVRVFRGGLQDRENAPVAVAYLGHAERDYPRPRQSGRRFVAAYSSHLNRVRSKLRLPPQRPGDRRPDERQDLRAIVRP
jgi:hypothetical protein